MQATTNKFFMKKTDRELKFLLATKADSSALRAAGYSASDVRAAGYSASDVLAAGYSASDVLAAGYSASDVRAAGYSASDVRAAGYSASDVRAAGYSASALRAAGYSASDVRAAGYTDKDLEEWENIPVLEKPYTRILDGITSKELVHDQATFGPIEDYDPELNVCGTPMCTAGHLVFMAGKMGYDLKKKYGWADAAALIHYKSHPGQPVQNFGSIPQSWAIAYIEEMADREVNNK